MSLKRLLKKPPLSQRLFCLCSGDGGQSSGFHVGPFQADCADGGPDWPLQGPDTKFPQGHPRCQHQLRGVRAAEDAARCDVAVKLDAERPNWNVTYDHKCRHSRPPSTLSSPPTTPTMVPRWLSGNSWNLWPCRGSVESPRSASWRQTEEDTDGLSIQDRHLMTLWAQAPQSLTAAIYHHWCQKGAWRWRNVTKMFWSACVSCGQCFSCLLFFSSHVCMTEIDSLKYMQYSKMYVCFPQNNFWWIFIFFFFALMTSLGRLKVEHLLPAERIEFPSERTLHMWVWPLSTRPEWVVSLRVFISDLYLLFYEENLMLHGSSTVRFLVVLKMQSLYSGCGSNFRATALMCG